MNAVPVSSTEALICQGTQTMSRLPRVNEREARLLLHRRFRIIGLSVQLFEQRVEGVFEVSHALFERGHASRGLRDGLLRSGGDRSRRGSADGTFGAGGHPLSLRLCGLRPPRVYSFHFCLWFGSLAEGGQKRPPSS